MCSFCLVQLQLEELLRNSMDPTRWPEVEKALKAGKGLLYCVELLSALDGLIQRESEGAATLRPILLRTGDVMRSRRGGEAALDSHDKRTF